MRCIFKKCFTKACAPSPTMPRSSRRYGHAAFASLYYSIEMDAPIIATIYGPKGRIHINHRAHNPESITLVLNGAPCWAVMAGPMEA